MRPSRLLLEHYIFLMKGTICVSNSTGPSRAAAPVVLGVTPPGPCFVPHELEVEARGDPTRGLCTAARGASARCWSSLDRPPGNGRRGCLQGGRGSISASWLPPTSKPFTQYAQKGPDFSYPFRIVLCNFSSFFRSFDGMGGKAPSPLILPDGKGTVMNTAMYNACLTASAPSSN